MPHPLYGELCSATLFEKPFQLPLAVFLPSVPLMPLQFAKHMLHTYCIPHDVLWWQNGASPGCPRFWTGVQLWRFSFTSTHVSLISITGSIFKQWLVAFLIFMAHVHVLWSWFVKTPDDYCLITLCQISSVLWHMLSQHISRCVMVCDLSLHYLFVSQQVWGCFCQGPHISYCCLCSLHLCNRCRSRV